MIEYRVYHVSTGIDNAEVLEKWMNMLSIDGWRYVGSVEDLIIFEREITPRIEENATENSRSVTYSWDFFKD